MVGYNQLLLKIISYDKRGVIKIQSDLYSF
jgi:hypothetical protein